jgi:hypothetical protein
MNRYFGYKNMAGFLSEEKVLPAGQTASCGFSVEFHSAAIIDFALHRNEAASAIHGRHPAVVIGKLL